MKQKVSFLIICFLNAKDLLNANNSSRFFNLFHATGLFLTPPENIRKHLVCGMKWVNEGDNVVAWLMDSLKKRLLKALFQVSQSSTGNYFVLVDRHIDHNELQILPAIANLIHA